MCYFLCHIYFSFLRKCASQVIVRVCFVPYLLYWYAIGRRVSVLVIATHYDLYSPGFEKRCRRYFSYPCRLIQVPPTPNLM